MHKCIQNSSSNRGLDAVLEGGFDGGLNVGLEWVPLMFTLKYEHISAVEGARNVSSEGKPTFDIEIKGTLEVTIELHLKMHMVVHWLGQKSTRNNSIKYEREETLYVVLEGAPKISF